MSYRTTRFLTEAKLRIEVNSEYTVSTIEVDNVDFTFVPIYREFNYVDLKREKELFGFQLDIDADFRWITASLPIHSFIQSKVLEINFEDIATGWMPCYVIVDPIMKYRRQVQNKEYQITFKVKDPFATLPSWAEPVDPSTIEAST